VLVTKVARLGEHSFAALKALMKLIPVSISCCVAGRFFATQSAGQCCSERCWSVMMTTMFGFAGRSVQATMVSSDEGEARRFSGGMPIGESIGFRYEPRR